MTLTIPAIVRVTGSGRGLMELSPGEVLWAFERAWRRTDEVGDCRVWTGYTKQGYGVLSVRNCHVYLHALSFAVAHGDLPVGHEVCHTCDVRPCWQPDHLFAGTRLDNVADMWAKGRAVPPPRVTGLRQHLARLTDEEVTAIRAAEDVDQRTLAAAFGCSQSTVWRIRHGRVRV